MDFEEMQAIWESQGERPTDHSKIGALLEIAQTRSRRMRRSVNVHDYAMLAICLGLAIHEAWEPLFRGTDRYQYVSAALFLGVAVYIWIGRQRRKRREQAFEANVLGDLDRATCRVDYQIWRSRTFLWWFLLPASLTILISLSQNYDTKPLVSWIVAFLSFPLSYAVVRLGLRCLLHDKRELATLSDELRGDTESGPIRPQ